MVTVDKALIRFYGAAINLVIAPFVLGHDACHHSPVLTDPVAFHTDVDTVHSLAV